MALTQTEVSQLYVSIFGRASEGDGNTYWQTDQADMVTTANVMLATEPAQDYFGDTLNDDQAFIEHIYLNTLGKTYAEDTAGVDYWVSELAGGKSKGEVIVALINAAQATENAGDAQDQFNNKVEVSDYTADNIAGFTDIDSFAALIADVDHTDASVSSAKEDVLDMAPDGVVYTLTNGSDKATANIFNADMVYTPDGSDRILSLQDEDELTGTAGRNDNTLNAEIGNRNADEGTTAVVTPELNNVQIVNLEWTGNTTTVDLRYTDDVETLNITKITSDATAVTVNNITTPAANLRVADAADAATNVTFNYQRGVLDGDEIAVLHLDDVLANNITQNALAAGAGVEGFETVNLNAVNGVDISRLSANEMETLTITGDNYLEIVTLTPIAPVTATEYVLLGAPGIANPAAVGLLDLNASAFEGDLTLDITASLGGFADPANSGAIVHGVVTGGVGDDTFWASANAAATTSTNRDVIDGGEGANKYITTAGVVGNASISNIQSLEMRQQAGAQTVDFDAFDEDLTSVLMRGEQAGASTFNLNDLGADLASDGLTLRHGISTAAAPTVNALLKDASGADDTIAITVENDLNTTPTFNYTLDFDGDSGDGDSVMDDGAVENVTVVDNDTEDNVLTLTQAQEHIGTVTLTGGVAGQSYTVNSSLVAATVEASAQLSDLRLIVGDTVVPVANVDQDIKLGAGDDILTFLNIDDFNTADSIIDAGGTDTVRAAFSEDANLTLTDIEGLHIIANDNVTLGMANADVENLVILADIAADGSTDNSPDTAEPFNIAGVTIADIITMNDTSLTELNFSADLDTDDSGNTDTAILAVNDDDSLIANFNGVTLANNTANSLTVNINSGLDFVDIGAQAYNLGQLTVHGVTSMDIQVSDEDTETTITGATAVTTINNIYAKNMTSLSLTAQEDVTLGTVSGAPLNNSLTTFDASNVGGDLTATVISLGNNATVTLADGDNTFSALGSAGKDIVITAGNGDNAITGSGQDDEITTGAGWDTIVGDRGDNVITAGAGDDTITAKDGNDTYDVGSGIDSVTDNAGTGIDATLSTNTVSMSGGVTTLLIDTDGAGGANVDQMLAVGAGSDLTLSWIGTVLQTASAVLDGRLATVDSQVAGIVTGDANSNLEIMTTTPGTPITFNGAAGNDVALFTGSALTDGLTFNGGSGNDAAVGTIDNDIFTGGTGADKLVLQDTAVVDTMVDTIVIADGESTASAWDVIVGFDATGVAGAAGVVVGTSTVGDDVLDIASTTIAGAVAGSDGTNVGDIETNVVAANGLVIFGTDDNDLNFADDIIMVGTGTGQLSLSDALGYLVIELNGTGSTVLFQYDKDGSGAITAADSAFIFQDGAEDTVIELTGVYTGVEAVGGGTAGLVEIA